MDALCMTLVGTPNARARNARSVWVVALKSSITNFETERLPEWISHNEESDVLSLRIVENVVCL
jgi:hypothetical protein